MDAPHAPETVLVTGGTGYLARWCIRELLSSGYTVHTTVRELSGEPGLRSLFPAAENTDQLRVFAADLLRDGGWEAAAAGCDYVLHVASPFPAVQPKNPDDLIIPARDGTLRVLRAAFDAGVRRVVVTSSTAAVRNAGAPAPSRPLTEDDWADPGNSKLSPYARSKTTRSSALTRGRRRSRSGPPGTMRTALARRTVSPSSTRARSSDRCSAVTTRSRCRPSSGCSAALCPPSPGWASPLSTSGTSPACTFAR
jgi:nucleoside-diphosphate-sugar epimerase